MKNPVLKCRSSLLDSIDNIHEKIVTYILRKTIGVNERQTRVFETDTQEQSMVGLVDEIGSICDTQISGIDGIKNLHLFENLSVELEQYKPICDFTDYQDQ